ncbi:MAG: hypothetical protein AAB539_00310 [Patescibacteria group bacterium]
MERFALLAYEQWILMQRALGCFTAAALVFPILGALTAIGYDAPLIHIAIAAAMIYVGACGVLKDEQKRSIQAGFFLFGAPEWMPQSARVALFGLPAVIGVLGILNATKPMAAFFAIIFGAIANLALLSVAFLGVYVIQMFQAPTGAETAEGAEVEAQGTARGVASYTTMIFIISAATAYVGRDIPFDDGLFLFLGAIAIGLAGAAWGLTSKFAQSGIYYALSALVAIVLTTLVIFRLIGFDPKHVTVGDAIQTWWKAIVLWLPAWAEWSLLAMAILAVFGVIAPLIVSWLEFQEPARSKIGQSLVSFSWRAALLTLLVPATMWFLNKPFESVVGLSPQEFVSTYIVAGGRGAYWRVMIFIVAAGVAGKLLRVKLGWFGLWLAVIGAIVFLGDWLFWGQGLQEVHSCLKELAGCPEKLEPFQRFIK